MGNIGIMENRIETTTEFRVYGLGLGETMYPRDRRKLEFLRI